MSSKVQEPRIDNISPLPSEEAKWIEFQKINWTDQEGKARVWEAANRKTRGSGGIDAVAIAPILLHPSKPPSVLIILQYRPPVQATCVEFPAGLIDGDETPETAALRELKEETGYSGKIVEMTPTIVSDPGLATANMQFAVVEVQLREGDAEPTQHLENGEHIERVVVPLAQLYEKLMAYSKEEGKIVDARLFHWAAGVHFATENAKKYGLTQG
ncbi:adp-ribose pyrophosphatase like protein [Venturia nashicola]|uniref:Adp-ribose pyrophosphatase like protein n=1 Tax=Venturia nashicola TaxID=86259 RepID=A0A4Z1P8G9_9PEZI|nr:adp-ribose pyrophosphatase like protein [Venturia nashicola]TLD37086.1 adp-ribose pyrophosphatase like protein [Venturia nashicola]